MGSTTDKGKNMKRVYNLNSMKPIRRKLRNNMTYVENLVWQQIRNKQLGVKFRRQYSVDRFVLDFYSPEIKLALEIDGSIHLEPDVRERDLIRQKHIEQYGIHFIRLTNKEILENPNMAFDKLIDVVKNRQIYS